jgi:two-component system cell cycle sensor histidine kinase/response regulator CckA
MESALARRECVLVADDDAALRKYVVEVLSTAGFQTIAAADGKSALGAARKHEGRIDLLLTDVMMPNLDGFDLREKLLLERKDVRIIIMSGQLDNEITGEDFFILRKPFRAEVLLSMVKQVLAAPVLRAVF